ncbi:MAG TPA: aminotransferase class III-fold pyridoxal phosphate-dependent enzyme [Polyangiaceae bacterium]|nr:aminotransferase class III-fold pyridoxal phosphate-dependent enzyme [Polyangiaceae bacterium]
MSALRDKLQRPSDPTIARSDALYARALGLIPACTQTLAKGPDQHVNGVAPKYLERGKGSHVWDVDGNEFVDLSMAIGPLSLGYAHPVVDDAIRRQLDRGITFSLMHPLEVEVAELVSRVVPCAEMVKFSKTGCDVTSAAVRLARAHTRRSRVLCCGYHGWHDWYISVTDRANGVPEEVAALTSTFQYGDLESLANALDDEVACVILEPVTFAVPNDGYLYEVKRLCDLHGAVLIFDEMWTGFRLAMGGAQEYFGVVPDLACFSKAIANGMPLSVLAGRRDIMARASSDVFFFTTFGGEALSLAAAEATIQELAAKRGPSFMAEQGKKLREGYNDLASHLDMNFTRCVGLDCRTLVTFDAKAGDPLLQKSLMQQELLRRGVLWNGFHNVSLSHTDDDVDHVLGAYAEVLPILRDAVARGTVAELLRGVPIGPVFRRTSGFDSKKRAPKPPPSGALRD